MRICFMTREGAVVHTLEIQEQATITKRLQDLARSALSDCYEWDDRSFWPKKDFRYRTPKSVEITTDAGKLIYSYTIHDLVRDTLRHLTSRP